MPVGNPSPAYAISVREGEDLYTDSVVVLDAMTGAYKRHFKLVPRDWHDWDVASPPALIHTLGGKTLLSVAPKDGHLYGIDLADNTLLYRTPVTKIENVEAPFAPDKAVRFCPGASGGSEWNGPAYDPDTNLIITGEVDWCTTVKRQSDEQLQDAPTGGPWFGNAMRNPFHLFGRQDEIGGFWGGWVYAVDADTGVSKWRLRSNYPIVSGVTPTAGGLVFVGDVGGNFYALDAADRREAMGPEDRRRDRRRRDRLSGRRGRKDRGDDRPYWRCLANRSGDRKDRRAGPRQRRGRSDQGAVRRAHSEAGASYA